MRLFERCLRYTSNLFYCSIHVSFFSFARQYDVICFVQALLYRSSRIFGNDLSRESWLNLEFTRKFTSRDFGFYIKPMRSELLRLDVILRRPEWKKFGWAREAR